MFRTNAQSMDSDVTIASYRERKCYRTFDNSKWVYTDNRIRRERSNTMSNLLVQNIKHTNNTTAQTIDTSGRTTAVVNNDNVPFKSF